jgi:hypothetical protein
MSVKSKFGLLLLIIVIISSCVTSPKLNNYSDYEYAIDLYFDVFEDTPGGPYIDITIGNDSYYAFFDTGHADTDLMIRSEIIEKLGLEAGEEYRFGSIDELYTVHEYVLPEFMLGDSYTVQNARIAENPPTFGDSSDSILIGLPAFKDYNILLSYRQKKLFLYKKTANLDFLRDWTKVDIIETEVSVEGVMQKQSGLFFNGNVEGIDHPFVFYLDTGSGPYDTMVLSQEIRDIATKRNRLTYVYSGRKFRMKNMRVSGSNIQYAPMDAFIGNAFLSQYDVFIDLDNQAFYIEK